MRVIYPGSFDPPTRGHVDIARRAAALYGDLVVVVMGNPDKGPGLSLERRAALLDKCLAGTPGLRVQVYRGLLADAVKDLGARAILRGLRDQGDYQAERPVADGFLDLFGVETVFMQCRPELGYVSSSMARQLLRLGGPAEGLLPEAIAQEIKSAYR